MTKQTRKSDYINRVKKGIEVYEAMYALENNANLYIMYGERGPFRITSHEFEHSPRSFTIGDTELFGRQMNIHPDKSGKSFLFCYSYDLFNTQTTAKLYFQHIEIIEKPEDK